MGSPAVVGGVDQNILANPIAVSVVEEIAGDRAPYERLIHAEHTDDIEFHIAISVPVTAEG